MIVLIEDIKVVDDVFYYPSSISDNWIEQDPFRELLKRLFSNNALSADHNVMIVFAHGIKSNLLKSLLLKNQDKKILMVYCGENIYGKNKIISHAYNAFQKLGISDTVANRLILNYPISHLLSIPSFIQHHAHIKKLIKQYPDYSYVLTNDLGGERDNIFFAPYFYFFCRHLIHRIQEGQDDSQYVGRKKFCAFVVSNPGNVDRIDFFKKLSAYKRIDSFGKVLNNAKLKSEAGEHYLNLLKYNHLLYRDYKFVISFENSYAKGYITEKLPNVLAGGSIPIYRGAPDIGDYFNLNRIINYEDYGCSYDRMVDKIIELDQDEDKYKNFVSQMPFCDNQLPPGYTDFELRLTAFIKKRFNIK